jgi:hypothetical protein
MLVEKDLLATMGEAEDVGRVELQSLSGAGRLSTEIAGLRMRWRGQLGLSWRRRLREARSKNRTVKFKNKMLTTVHTTLVTAQKVGLDAWITWSHIT